MGIEKLFESLHGMLDVSKLIRATDMPPNLMEAYNLSSHEIETRIAPELEVDADHLYYNPEGGIYPFCYWDGFFYYGLHSLHDAFLGIGDDPMFHESTRFKHQYKHMYELLAKKEWSSIMSFADKKVSFLVFEYLRQKTNMPESIQKKMFLETYARNEYGFDRLNQEMVRDILNMPTPHENDVRLCNEYDADADGYYTIYRGETIQSSPLSKAFSWTLSYKVAEFFATRFNTAGCIHHRRVHISDIKAYIANRSEFEVIVFPEDIRRVK